MFSWPVSQPASHVVGSLTLDIARKLVYHFVVPAMLIGTIDLHRCMPLSVTLIFTAGYKIREQQNFLGSFSVLILN